jgi:hypothetical protein
MKIEFKIMWDDGRVVLTHVFNALDTTQYKSPCPIIDKGVQWRGFRYEPTCAEAKWPVDPVTWDDPL